MILDEIIEELSYFLKNRRVINICVGVSYTSSLLDDQSLGFSHTVFDGSSKFCGEIINSVAYDIVRDVETPLARSIAVSILNAIKLENFEKGDLLSQHSGNKLCVFGYSPNVSNASFSSIIVYDFGNPQETLRGKVVIKPYNSFSSERCDVVGVFGSALINSSIDTIINNVSTDHLLLLGASTVYAPNTLRKYGFEAIERLELLDKYKAFRIICEGGGAKELSKFVVRYFKKL
jgi:uncharacterized protein (DUF4213/DUF364 family)